MKKFNLFLLTIGTLLICNLYSAAQTPAPAQNFADNPRANTQRKSFWFETNIGGSITANKRWQYQIDYQYRRMADASYIKGGDHGNIFKDPYQQVIRPWIHFWAIPGQVRLSLSPIGYWSTRTPPAEGSIYPSPTGNTGSTVFPEFRICPQITLNNQYGRFQVINRMRYEFRFIGNRHATSNNFFEDLDFGYSFYPNSQGQGYGSSHQGRLRWQMRIQVPLNNKKVVPGTVYINTWNELFIGLGKHVNYNKMFNQNRLVAMLGFMLPGKFPIKVESGITYQAVALYNIGAVPTQPDLTYQKQNVEYNLAYTTYLIFDEFHHIFKKKKQEAPTEK
jgi:hypothetical protein